MTPIPFAALPFPARLAIEYQDCQDYGKRSITQLDEFLKHYFDVYGQICAIEIRRACHDIQKQKHHFNDEDLNGYIDECAPSHLEAWQRIVDHHVIGVSPLCGHNLNVSVEINGKDYFAKINLRDHNITMFDHAPNQGAYAFIQKHVVQFHMLSHLFAHTSDTHKAESCSRYK